MENIDKLNKNNNTLKVYQEINTPNEKMLILDSSKFKNKCMCDTYDNYGQKVGCYNSGCYALSNSASNATEDCIKTIKKEFKINSNIEIEIIEDVDDGYVLDTDIIEDEYVLSLTNKIDNFIKKWRKENENHPNVITYGYWDGHNWKSLIIDNEFNYDYNDLKEINVELEQKILNAFQKYNTYIHDGASKSEIIDGFKYSNSRYQNDYAIAWVEIVD